MTVSDAVAYVAVLLLGILIGRLTAGAQDGALHVPRAPLQPLPPDVETEIRDLMRQGRKIDAIKRFRQATGAGLKDAKDAVEAM